MAVFLVPWILALSGGILAINVTENVQEELPELPDLELAKGDEPLTSRPPLIVATENGLLQVKYRYY